MSLTRMFCLPPLPPRYKPGAIAPMESNVPNNKATKNLPLTIVGRMSQLNVPLGISLVARPSSEG